MHFFPRADAGLLSSRPHNIPPRPKNVGPIFDKDNFKTPVQPWTDHDDSLYPPKSDPFAPASIPPEPTCPSSKYLRTRLAKNERLRLSMLWYYARDLDSEPELLAGLQEKACLAQENSGWEYAVVGLLDVNVYIRLATVGLQLAILPRGETLCAHTVTQPPGNVFLLPNMLQDWRFRESPYVELGGLTAYAGVPLRMQHESGECVGLGSLCVASATPQPPLSKSQQQALARLADWIVADIVQCTRARRQRERRRFAELIATLQREPEGEDVQEPILQILRQAYPDESISLQAAGTEQTNTGAFDSKHGLWEDDEYIEDFIANSNHSEPPKDRVVRFISAQCETRLGPSVLVVATKDFRRIFDDVDSWFLHTCSTLLTQRWQKRLLGEVMRAKEKFLRGVSHQLRTPIHGILGAAELLNEDLRSLMMPGTSEPRHGVEPLMQQLVELEKSAVYLDTISTAGRELMSTVNSMITLNRWADVAAAERQYATHSIQAIETALVKGLAEFTSRDARPRASVFFHHNLTPAVDGLLIDLNLFRDSVLPLITNAVQNTSEGLVTVTTSYAYDTTVLTVDVHDTGCGIRPGDQNRIFELYEKVAEHSTGAGLGLALAVKFSALLHGSVELVSSEVGRGSHFRATFRDVRSAVSSSPVQSTVSQFKHLPASFRYLPSDTPDVHLPANLVKYLRREGLFSSNDSNECLNIVDYVSNPEQRQRYESILPKGQVAICLIPNLNQLEVPESSCVIFVKGPFSTSTLDSALIKAEELLRSMRESPRESPHSASVPTQANASALPSCQGSDRDEGYGSINGSPAPQVGANETPKLPTPPESQTATPSAQTEPIDLPIRPLIAVTASAKPLTLIVDDNVVNLRILEMYCKKRGLPYLSAVDGQQAVDIFTQHTSGGPPILLVLMNLQMPVCDGISATRQIRSLEKSNGNRLCQPRDSSSHRQSVIGHIAQPNQSGFNPLGTLIISASAKQK
ncbi:histidine kinase [Fusarium heterosporum]|uniref:histidine kinase n=1 Tax=Fusarium heterosporum TaxID=42747 RepID=A0A8H5T1L1_FUSHE|nr:histidine kinase [Fusarium heterosporum]